MPPRACRKRAWSASRRPRRVVFKLNLSPIAAQDFVIPRASRARPCSKRSRGPRGALILPRQSLCLVARNLALVRDRPKRWGQSRLIRLNRPGNYRSYGELDQTPVAARVREGARAGRATNRPPFAGSDRHTYLADTFVGAGLNATWARDWKAGLEGTCRRFHCLPNTAVILPRRYRRLETDQKLSS
jgi:hypothetical protein